MNYMCFIYYWHYSCARQVQSWIVVTDNEMLSKISQTGQFEDSRIQKGMTIGLQVALVGEYL